MTLEISIAILILLIIHPSASVNSDCEYSDMKYDVIDIIYHCKVKNSLNIKSREKANIESETGVHKDGKSNDNVLGWEADGKNVEYFPQGLEKVFKNLKAVSVLNGKIKEISKTDLKSYTNLEVLGLFENNIEYIEDDLFKFNSKLKVITFTGNKLFHIYSNVFENLKDLKLVYLKSCSCVNTKVDTHEMFWKDIIKLSVKNCNNLDFSGAIERLASLKTEANGITYENLQPFKEQLITLEDDINNSTLSSSLTIKNRFKDIRNKLRSIKKPKSSLKAARNQTISSIDDFFANFQQIFNDLSGNLLDDLENTENELDNGQDGGMDSLNGSILDLQGRLNNFTAEATKEKLKFGACDVYK